jgi:hypothetical protein
MNLGLPLPTKVLLTVLKKLYAQKADRGERKLLSIAVWTIALAIA